MCVSFKKCCFCISLQVGANIISIASIVVSASLLLLYGTAATLLRRGDSRLAFYSGMAIAAGCQCMLGFALAYGVFMKSPRWMLPWTVFSWGKSVVLICMGIIGSVALMCSSDYQQAVEANAMISAYIMYSLVLFYCACVVNSRRLQLMRERFSDYRPALMVLSASEFDYSLKP